VFALAGYAKTNGTAGVPFDAAVCWQ